MAGRGPAPKDSHARARDTARRKAAVVIVQSDGQIHGPELPEGIDWPDATRDWWGTWRSAPQAQAFTDTDWSFLLDTAILHMEFWDGDRSVAGELRLRAAKFGATPEDRARLKMTVGEPEKGGKAPRGQGKAAAARRDRLLRAVGDGEG